MRNPISTISSSKCEKKILTVQHRAGVTHHLTLPLHDLFGPFFVINPLNFFTDGPGHNAGHNEAVDYADVFQYVAFQGTFLFRFFYIIT